MFNNRPIYHLSQVPQLVCPWTTHDRLCGSTSFLPLVAVLTVNMCSVKRSFKLHQNVHNSVKEARERGKKLCNIDPKISMTIVFHYPVTYLSSSSPKIPKAFPTTFPTCLDICSLLNAQQKEKWSKKSKRREEDRKRKENVKTAVWLLNPKILFSAHPPTSEVNIFHLHHIRPRRLICGKFQLFKGREWLENSSTSFKTQHMARSDWSLNLRILKWD